MKFYFKWKTCQKHDLFLKKTSGQSQFYNHFHNILRLFDVLPNFPFTPSETPVRSTPEKMKILSILAKISWKVEILTFPPVVRYPRWKLQLASNIL